MATCVPAAPSIPGDLWLLGQGHCTNAQNLTSSGYLCNNETFCAALATSATCGQACATDPACTGFELVTMVSATTNASLTKCTVLTLGTPFNQSSANWIALPGTQGLEGHVVATTDLSPDTCCYKRAYPYPNPKGNPLKMPPVQTPTQKVLWTAKAAEAKVAAANALPNLTEQIAFCAENTTLFNATECPGMEYAIAAGAVVCNTLHHYGNPFFFFFHFFFSILVFQC